MHGTGQFSAFITLALGGCIITMPNRNFDPAKLWDTVERDQVNSIVIVGQAFAGPMLESLDENPSRWNLSSVVQMGSSGVMWSQENKNALLEHIPQMFITDSFGSSEAVGMGMSVAAKGAAPKTAQFALGPNCVVFTEEGERVQPGSGERGLVAVGGAIPVGYYKDEVKSAQTFRMFEGRRWTVPGDWAEVNEDGTLHLLGRGSVCINTGGEKVFPEEVEEVLKTHESVRDAVAVGIPDKRFMETICAVVEAEPGFEPTLDELSAHVKTRLAAYKAPRNVVVISTIGRAPNGKVDYKRLKQHAMDELGIK
jgi:fatty-acyl-CoA synthase